MISVQEIKKRLTIDHILEIMSKLGATHLPTSEDSNIIQFLTVCHHGDSHKLYFYKDTKEFHCYTNCGQMDVINLLQNSYNIDFPQALGMLCRVMGITSFDGMREGFGDFDDDNINEDLEWLRSYESNINNIDFTRDFKILDEKILDSFRKMYHPAFYNDNISIETLHKYGIRYDLTNRRIIIPHRDENGNLIAVRCRNLEKHMLDLGLKYMPITYKGKLLSTKTTKYFYGLNFNKENIKKIKKVILVESEKAVMQLEDILGNNIALALSSSSISLVQIELLKELGVEEVILALDKEYEEYGSKEEKNYAMKIKKGFINKLQAYFSISILWDKENLLEYKDSPTDKGGEVFMYLYNKRIIIN